MRRQALSRCAPAPAPALRAGARRARCRRARCSARRQHARQRADAEDPRRPQGHGRPGRRRRGQRGEGDRGLSQVPRRSRRRRRSAPRRCAGSATSRWTCADSQQAPAARRRPPDYKAAIARYQDFLKNYPNDPNNDRVLYQMARALRAERRPRDGAEDARPAGQGLPGDALPRRGAVPARRAAVHAPRTTPSAEKAFATVLRRARRDPVPGPLALHARLVAVQAGPARGRAAARSSACSTSSSPARDGETGLDSLAGPDAAPTASWSRTPSASPASAWPTCRAPSRSRRS